MIPLVEIHNLIKHFPTKDQQVFAINDLSMTIYRGEILGLAGESGCGKSTLGRCLVHLVKPTSGTILYDGKVIDKPTKELRKKIQIIFQDPFSSLNPMMNVGQILGEPFTIHGIASGQDKAKRVRELLMQVGLEPDCTNKYPHEFSGGQRQRISIARALALNPEFLVCDEPISALDATIQKQIIELFNSLHYKKQLTLLWISHDLSVMQRFAHRIAVMYLGRLMELGPAREVFKNPAHPYTQALSSAIPIPDPLIERQRPKIVLVGDVPSPSNPPTGCVFHTRCPMAKAICSTTVPPLKEITSGRFTACHFASDRGEAAPVHRQDLQARR